MVRDGVSNPRVLKAVAGTEQHQFMPSSQCEKAYLDLALPIGHSATTSPPYRTEQLDPRPTDKVLEIGTGGRRGGYFSGTSISVSTLAGIIFLPAA